MSSSGTLTFTEDSELAQGWLILGELDHAFAIRSDLVAGVFRTSEAKHVHVEQPQARIQIHDGRPWFVVAADQVFQTFSHRLGAGTPMWTVTLVLPAGLAFQVTAVEGPYRGVVFDNVLRTQHGNWPVMTPLQLETT